MTLADKLAPDEDTATTIMLVNDTAAGVFCCPDPSGYDGGGAGWNVTTAQCGFPNQGSVKPFTLAAGLPIFNRSDGSTSLNSTAVTTTTTVTAAVSTVTESAVPSAKPADDSSCHATTIGAGVGVPLGLLWAVTAGLLVWRWRKPAQIRYEQRPMIQADAARDTKGAVELETRAECETAGNPINELEAR